MFYVWRQLDSHGLSHLPKVETECKNQKPLDTHYHRANEVCGKVMFVTVCACHSVRVCSEVITNDSQLPSRREGISRGLVKSKEVGMFRGDMVTRGDTLTRGDGYQAKPVHSKVILLLSSRKSQVQVFHKHLCVHGGGSMCGKRWVCMAKGGMCFQGHAWQGEGMCQQRGACMCFPDGNRRGACSMGGYSLRTGGG